MSKEKIGKNHSVAGQATISEGIPSFLLKTYDILENSKYSSVACWTKNGQGFVIKNVREFSQSILPTHFRHSNFTSFVRQLNMYDFHKIRQEDQENGFRNSMFKRGQKHLLRKITRKDYKKKKQKPEEKEMSTPTQKQNCILSDEEERVGFYSNALTSLQQMSKSISKKQLELAEIKNIKFNDEGIANILQSIMKVKQSNSKLLMQASQIDWHWQQILAGKKIKIAHAHQHQNEKEEKQQSRKEDGGCYLFKNQHKIGSCASVDATFHTFSTLGTHKFGNRSTARIQ